MNGLLRLRERLLGLAAWDASRITDEWFRAHFGYAADVVQGWLGSVSGRLSAGWVDLTQVGRA